MNSKERNPIADLTETTEILDHRDRLRGEINALQHELRRVRDGLERAGGVSQDLEQRAQQLTINIELCKKDLINIQQRLSD